MNKHFRPPTPEEGMRGIAKANSPQKLNVIRAAQQLQADRISQYNQGLLTPHDLAEAMVEIWLEAVEMTR